MTTEEDEYYDSIDDSEFESCRSFCNTKFQDEESDIEEDTIKLEDLVPFYTGNVEIDSIKNESKSNSGITLKSKRPTRAKKPSTSTYDKRKNRSYLTIFYERSALQSKSEVTNSSRATCVELSPKSYISCSQDHSCYFDKSDDSDSFYKRFMEKEKNRNNQNRGENPSTTCMSCLIDINSETKLHSVSELQCYSLEQSKNSSRDMKIMKTRPKPVKICDLGGLGPNIAPDKLELLRKRQDYGRRVSQRNRIQIMENKVVNKFKQEIRESRKF